MTSSAFDPARLNRFEPLVLLFGLFEHVFLSLSCVWSSAGELGGLDRIVECGTWRAHCTGVAWADGTVLARLT